MLHVTHPHRIASCWVTCLGLVCRAGKEDNTWMTSAGESLPSMLTLAADKRQCREFVYRIRVWHTDTEQGLLNGTVSARPSMVTQRRSCCCRFAQWARLAGDIDRLLQQRRANAGSATLSAYVGGWTRLVICRHLQCRQCNWCTRRFLPRDAMHPRY